MVIAIVTVVGVLLVYVCSVTLLERRSRSRGRSAPATAADHWTRAGGTGRGMSRSRSWPDERLLEAAQGGGVTSLTAVVMESQPRVRRLALSLCATPQDAEEAARSMDHPLPGDRHAPRLRPPGLLASWTFRIVRDECLRNLRLLTPAPVAEAVGIEPVPSTESSVPRRLDAERVAAAYSSCACTSHSCGGSPLPGECHRLHRLPHAKRLRRELHGGPARPFSGWPRAGRTR
ncbi:hypothetical protein [Streptomyces sp. NBC_01214]|uniref:hypothetical protein n=1 Tax=Streptomyces sp. NBC_01214 TaxID=2903777 RepID=UPI002B1E1AB2|nr:hypothetical protein [Streptomyces sp. NBC_01214]